MVNIVFVVLLELQVSFAVIVAIFFVPDDSVVVVRLLDVADVEAAF